MKPISKALASFFSKFLFVLIFFSILKLLFYAFNYNYVEIESYKTLIGSIRFDWMTIGILYLPLWFTHLFFYKGKHILLRILFHFSNSIALFASILDFEYYKFTFKRTTADILNTKGLGDDITTLAPQFIMDYWYLIVLYILFIWLSDIIYKKLERIEVPKFNWWQYLSYAFIIIVFTGIAFRGGIQYKPLGIIQAAKYATGKNVALVLNTPFTIIKTWDDTGLELKEYFSEEEAKELFDPVNMFKADTTSNRDNVVIIILESFSKEYIGALSGKESYTPFLDSLIKFSSTSKNTFANGKKSIEALPSILSGIPSLMNESYISSTYGGNEIMSIAKSLKKYGYRSSFYHGGANGTMGFDAFTSVAGIDDYVGLNEYPNNKDYDGNWGIFDEPFLKFVNKELSKTKQPFISSIFTLSSHHPYTIPDKYEGKFKKGSLPIHESIGYTDRALKKFFSNASKEDWFRNTLFIITADHTAQSKYKEYGSMVGIFKVPIIFYHPSKELSFRDSEIIIQQSDIYPSIIDWLNLEESIFAFGNSAFDTTKAKFSIQYINNIYQLIQGEFVLHSDGEKIIGLYEYRKDPLLKKELSNDKKVEADLMLKKLQAVIQQYNTSLIQNQMLIK